MSLAPRQVISLSQPIDPSTSTTTLESSTTISVTSSARPATTVSSPATSATSTAVPTTTFSVPTTSTTSTAGLKTTLSSLTTFAISTNGTTSTLLSTKASAPMLSTAGAATATVTTEVYEKHSDVLVGATVGGAIAGFAIICVILYSCCFFSRRRHWKKTLPPPPLTHSALRPSYPETYPAQQGQRPTNISPFIVGEPSDEPLTGTSQSNMGGCAKPGQGVNEHGIAQESEGVSVPSATKVPSPVGVTRQAADLPPAYTVLPEVG